MRGVGRTLEERLRIEAEHDALDVHAPRHAHDRRGGVQGPGDLKPEWPHHGLSGGARRPRRIPMPNTVLPTGCPDAQAHHYARRTVRGRPRRPDHLRLAVWQRPG